MANLSEMRGGLGDSWLQLENRWHETGSVWNDSVRWQFEKEYWETFSTQVMVTAEEMRRLAEVIAQARRNVK